MNNGGDTVSLAMNIYQMRQAILAKHKGDRFTPTQLKAELLEEFPSVKPQSVNPSDCFYSDRKEAGCTCRECEKLGGFAVNRDGVVDMGASGFGDISPVYRPTANTPSGVAQNLRDGILSVLKQKATKIEMEELKKGLSDFAHLPDLDWYSVIGDLLSAKMITADVVRSGFHNAIGAAYNIEITPMGRASTPEQPIQTKPMSNTRRSEEGRFDVFISHATEDKAYVEPLVSALEAAGIRVWFDKTTLEWGDDLRSSIDRGLENSRYGIVIFSKAFLGKKKWTEYELNSLFALEKSSRTMILPIWHGTTRADLVQYSPSFADRLAKVSSTDSYQDIVASLLRMLGRPQSQEQSLVNATLSTAPEGRSMTFIGRQLLQSAKKWRAWLGGGTALALATLVVAVFPTESHDFAIKLLHSPVTAWNRITRGKVGLDPHDLKRYTTFNVTGSFQQGYSIDKDSTILIDGETGYEMDASITVLGPNNSKEIFTAKPNYGIESMYQWQNQGSSGGSLDLQFKPRTFAGFTGGKLTNSAYWPFALKHNIDSSDTILTPIATSDIPP